MNNINGPMYGEPRDIDIDTISPEQIEEIEDERVKMLEEWGIDESAVIAEIHKNRGSWTAYFEENNTKGKEDLEFYYRDQWTSIERSEFDRTFTPALVINKLYDPIRKIIGEQRENTPQIKVRSVTGKAEQASIDLNTDMLKRIAYSSNSKVVYQQCFQSQMLFSYGAFMVDIDYENSKSFFQDIMYKWKEEPEKCFWDPRAMESHKGDGNFCGFPTTLSVEEYDARYPNVSHPQSFSDPSALTMFQWYDNETIVVVDYWVKEWYTKTILLLGTGEVVTDDEFEEMKKTGGYAELKKLQKSAAKKINDMEDEIDPEVADNFITGMVPPEFEVVNQRVTDDYRIMHYRCTADKVLEFEEWPSKMLPLIFCAGDTYYEQGQQYTRSFLNQAKDAQRTINYLASNIAGQLKNSSKGQWLGTPTNVMGPGMEYQWQNPETQQGILLANPDSKKGSDPMPTRIQPSELPQSLIIHYNRATADLKEVLGVYDTQLGAEGPAEANRTVANRISQGMGSASIFRDNLNRAIEQAAKVALDMFPAVYDTERTLTLTRANGTQYTTTINQQMDDGSTQNVIEKGDFDLELDAGPSYAMQKKEAIEILLGLVQAGGANPNSPPVFPLVADLVAKNLDLEFSQQLAERFKIMVPPAVLAKEEGKPPPPPEPNPQEQMMQKQMQLADAKLEDSKHELQIREAKMGIEQQRAKLQQAELMLKAQSLQHDMEKERMRDATEQSKTQLDFQSEMIKILADLKKSGMDFSTMKGN
jgi:hypothetical protein